MKMREIGETVRSRWPGVRRVALLHRTGRLEIGEASVLIAVSAEHRGDAFEACRHAIIGPTPVKNSSGNPKMTRKKSK